MAKMTAPMGAPKIADIAPAAPQPINRVLFFAFRCIKAPTLEPIAEPVITIGASKPTEPPKPTVKEEVSTRLKIFTRGIRLDFFEMVNNTSGIPCPPTSFNTYFPRKKAADIPMMG